MTFDPSLPVQTRAGHPARIICTDAEGAFPIIALLSIADVGGCPRDIPYSYTVDGRSGINRTSCRDLINVPTRVERFMNVYPLSTFSVRLFNTDAQADEGASALRIGILKLTFNEEELAEIEYKKLK